MANPLNLPDDSDVKAELTIVRRANPSRGGNLSGRCPVSVQVAGN